MYPDIDNSSVGGGGGVERGSRGAGKQAQELYVCTEKADISKDSKSWKKAISRVDI